ncbi:hypothetical protein ACS0TY_031194 [Phlomoides rotata]
MPPPFEFASTSKYHQEKFHLLFLPIQETHYKSLIATPTFAEPIKKARESGHNIGLSITPFPPQGSALPNHFVSLDQMTTPELIPKFFRAIELLQQPIETILQELN